MLLSVVLGLTLAWLFYRATCAGGQCLVIGKHLPHHARRKVHVDTDGRCYRFDKFNTYCQFPIPEGHTDFIPGGSYQDPGYFQHENDFNTGSIGAAYEGFGYGSWTPEEKKESFGYRSWTPEEEKKKKEEEAKKVEKFTAGCLGLDPTGTEYPSTNFYQVACHPEPKWNLPRDARMFHQAMYPCGVPGQCNESRCSKHHPMDTIYAPPNEGIMTRQVRN